MSEHMPEHVNAKSGDTFTTADALRLVSAVFDTEWPSTELKDVKLTKITGGFVNRLHLITRTTTAKEEPSSILIRHFGLGMETFHEEPVANNTTLSAAEQALIYYEMGRRGWGPKLYGIFKGGRLEEYIDAHPLTPAEAADDSIRRDLARSYARLHSLQLPLRKNFGLLVKDLKNLSRARKAGMVRNLLAFDSTEATKLARRMQQTDWPRELDWASGLFEEHQCKATIAVGDDNFLNVLVKNYDSECRVVLIDYETCTYSYRGVDIGGHFNERMYCWSNTKTNVTGCAAPDIDEQRSFCRSYVEEMRALGMALSLHDTEEHLLLEAQIGRMWQFLLSVGMCFNADEWPDDPAMFAGLSHQMETYWQLKEEWIRSN